MVPAPSLAWAKSLLGRDWEIYWGTEESASSIDGVNNISRNGRRFPTSTAPLELVVDDDDDDLRDSSDESDNEDQFGSNWYDGTVLSVRGRSERGFEFDVKFLGDHQVYAMILTPSIVRPCARTWIKRSKAVLGLNDIDEATGLEASLPESSSALADLHKLSQLSECVYETTVESSSSVAYQERLSIAELLYVVNVQLHLRKKLAKIAADDAEKGEGENYVNHLVRCLELLAEACKWYKETSDLQDRCLSASEAAEKVDVDRVRSSIENGWDLAMQLLGTEISTVSSSAKRKQQPSNDVPHSPQRASKRRKLKKIPELFEDVEEFGKIEEGGFVPHDAIERLSRVLHECDEWYMGKFGELLLSLSAKVQDPLLRWRKRVENLVSGEGPAGDESESNDGEDESLDARVYTYEDLEAAHTEASEHPVLRRFNLEGTTNDIVKQMNLISSIESEAQELIARIPDDPPALDTTEGDTVLSALKLLLERVAQIPNVSPLAKNASSDLTARVLEDSIGVRQFVLDVCHASRVRERVGFVETVAAKASELPALPGCACRDSEDFAARLKKWLEAANSLSERLAGALSQLDSAEQRFAESCNSNSESNCLRTLEGAEDLLKELEQIPFLSPTEEKLRVHIDVLECKSQCDSLLADDSKSLSYENIASCYELLSILKNGESQRRSAVANGLGKHHSLDKEIRQFVQTELASIDTSSVDKISRIYSSSKAWKDRSDAVITALRIHGNHLTGAAEPSNKQAAMVDMRRIYDLIVQYPSLGVSFQESSEMLQHVYDDGIRWSSHVQEFIDGKACLYEKLIAARETRPKGIVMEPARHVVDGWLEALDWHARVVSECERVAKEALPFSDELLGIVNRLSIEGLELLQVFSAKETQFTFDIEDARSKLAEDLRPIKMLSRAKLCGTVQGQKIVDHILSSELESESNYPLHCLLFMVWRNEAIEMVGQCTSGPPQKGRPRLTLAEARSLLAKAPTVADNNNGSMFGTFTKVFTTEPVTRFHELIASADELKHRARESLSHTKESIRGSYRNDQQVKEYFTTLKEIQAANKSVRQRGSGFGLDTSSEKHLDQRVRDLAWLVKTLPFPALHFDDVDTETGRIGGIEITEGNALPWDVLVSLKERLPASANDPASGDITRVALRVRELHEAANEWQEEVTKHLPLSFRGSKRRAPGGASEEGETPKLDMGKLAQLAKHTILRRVSMPRETAVRDALKYAHKLDVLLFDMLGQDYNGKDADKAAHPESDSLVGDNGSFHIYRLTESPLFKSLESLVHRTSEMVSSLNADTPGKIVFEWIEQLVDWIGQLRDAISNEYPFDTSKMLCIAAEDAQKLREEGKKVLVDGLSEEVRKTLSAHRIFVTLNKAGENLVVTIAKGGSHHSTGGTAIKWAPLLLAWLQEDIERLTEWDKVVAEHAKHFRQIAAEEMRKANCYIDFDIAYRVYSYREETVRLLEEGASGLVCMPRKNVVDGLKQLVSSLQKWIDKGVSDSKGAISWKALKRRRYQDGNSCFENRDVALDDLVYRKQAGISSKATLKVNETSMVDPEVSYREKGRSILEKALKRGMRLMDFGDAIRGQNLEVFCSYKAWELEQAVFDEYFDDQAGYRDKVRSLRSNMEDAKNPLLGARFLNDELNATALVQMSVEQMASKHVRKRKAEAQAAKDKTVILTKPGRIEAKKPRKDLKPAPTVRASVATSSPTASKKAGVSPNAVKSPTTEIAPGSQLGRTVRRSKPSVPPPPSLALGTGSPKLSIDAAGTQIGTAVMSKSGSDRFTFSISQPSLTFRASLYSEDNFELDNFLPEVMSEKGRLPTEEFAKFLASKTNTGRWSAVPLRMKVSAGTGEYKKFYREYENKGRIAMFGVSRETKVFIVTPKFHSHARGLREKFSNQKSSYVVVLTKERFFFD